MAAEGDVVAEEATGTSRRLSFPEVAIPGVMTKKSTSWS
jgi:hypothetical protein